MTFDALIARLRELREINNHGDAYLIAAKWLGATKLAEDFDCINRRHEALGYLPPDMVWDRHEAYQDMLKVAQRALSPSNYERFYQSF